jgi:hypothetical protein
VFGAVFSFAFCLLVSVFAVYRSVRLWGDPEYYERTAVESGFGGYSRAFRRGIVRGWVPLTAGFAALTVASALYLYAQVAHQRTPIGLVRVGVALLVLMVVFEGLLLLVAWFNVPKLLVPPHARSEPGFWEHRRSGRRR